MGKSCIPWKRRKDEEEEGAQTSAHPQVPNDSGGGPVPAPELISHVALLSEATPSRTGPAVADISTEPPPSAGPAVSRPAVSNESELPKEPATKEPTAVASTPKEPGRAGEGPAGEEPTSATAPAPGSAPVPVEEHPWSPPTRAFMAQLRARQDSTSTQSLDEHLHFTKMHSEILHEAKVIMTDETVDRANTRHGVNARDLTPQERVDELMNLRELTSDLSDKRRSASSEVSATPTELDPRNQAYYEDRRQKALVKLARVQPSNRASSHPPRTDSRTLEGDMPLLPPRSVSPDAVPFNPDELSAEFDARFSVTRVEDLPPGPTAPPAENDRLRSPDQPVATGGSPKSPESGATTPTQGKPQDVQASPAGQPAASPQKAPSRRSEEDLEQLRIRTVNLWMIGWIQFLELAVDDVFYWNAFEALLKTHVLYRLVQSELQILSDISNQQDSRLFVTQSSVVEVFTESGQDENPSTNVMQSAGVVSDGGAKEVVKSLMYYQMTPPDIVQFIPTTTHELMSLFHQSTNGLKPSRVGSLQAFSAVKNSVEDLSYISLAEMKERISVLQNRLSVQAAMAVKRLPTAAVGGASGGGDTGPNGGDIRWIMERWESFSNLMNIFGLNYLFSFDVQLSHILSQTTFAKIQKNTVRLVKSFRAFGGLPSEDTSEIDDTVMEPIHGGGLTRVTSTANLPLEDQTCSADIKPDAKPVENRPTDKHERGGEGRWKGFKRTLSMIRHPHFSARYRRAGSLGTQGDGLDWSYEDKKSVVIAYRLLDDGMVHVRIKAKLQVASLSLIMTLDNLSGFKDWVPFCTETTKHASFSEGTYLVSYISDLPWPIKKKETLAYCGGIDALDEIGNFIIFLQTPKVGATKVLDFPLPEKNPKIPRFPKSYVAFFIKPLSSEVSALEVHAMMDPGMSARIMRGLISWIVKNTVFDFFQKIVTLSKKLDPENLDESRATGHDLEHFQLYRHIQTRIRNFLAESEDPLKPANNESKPPPSNAQECFDPQNQNWYKRLDTFGKN